MKTRTEYGLELISFDLCPYVQRAVVTLKQKNAAFRTTYIDLASPPAWFDAISPLGKVPVLKVDGADVIFESSVICEFLDETIEPRFHLADPVARAKERAWMEFGATLIGDQGGMMRENDETAAFALKAEFFADLARVESVLANGPYFRGADFSLVDASFAPVFFRLDLMPVSFYENELRDLPKIRTWMKALLALPSVRESVIPEYREKYFARMRAYGSALARGLS